MAKAIGASHDLSSLLSSDGRDHLIRNNGDQVKISSLVGKIVGLYFSASWCGPCRKFTPTLVDVYQEISPKGEFEVVFVSSDRDDESFNQYFSKMPWLAIPFAEDQKRKGLKELFEVRGIPSLVVIGADGKVATDQAAKIVREHGAEGYPFSAEQLEFLKEKQEIAKKNQTLSSLLVSGSRDFVISNDGITVPVAELEGKMVGLYFYFHGHPMSVEFALKLVEVYKKLKEKGESFEVVLVGLDSKEEEFKKGFETMPWLALPFQDNICEKLTYYFDLQALPTLVIIGPDGKTLNPNVADLIEDHGADAYPFSPEKLAEFAEIKKARLEAQTLESLLVQGETNFVLDKSSSQVLVSELAGKNILLYFSAQWCPPCRAFLPKLIEIYHEIKAKDDEFEIIFISSDRDQPTYDEFYSGMPWLALPFGDQRKGSLQRRFKVQGIPAAVAIGPTGKTITTDARKHLTTYGADAYPFTEEHLIQLEEAKLRAEMAEKKGKDGWICDGDVCRKA